MGEIPAALSEGVNGPSPPLDSHIEDLRDVDEGQAELPNQIHLSSPTWLEDLEDLAEGQAELLEPIDLSFRPIDDPVEDFGDVDEGQAELPDPTDLSSPTFQWPCWEPQRCRWRSGRTSDPNQPELPVDKHVDEGQAKLPDMMINLNFKEWSYSCSSFSSSK